MTFRTRSFLTALATAAVTLTVAMTMMSWSVRRSVGDRIERALVNEARLAAETLSHRRPATSGGARRRGGCARTPRLGARDLHRPGRHASSATRSCRAKSCARSRITAIAPRCSRRAADGLGVVAALQRDARHRDALRRRRRAQPDAPMISEMRLALPLTEHPRRARGAAAHGPHRRRRGPGARRCCWRGLGSLFLSGRVRTIAEVASRYAAGDFSRPARDYGTDEIGDGGARARRVDSRHRPARRRPGHRSGAHGSHPRRHGRRGPGRQHRGTVQLANAAARGCCGCRKRLKDVTTSRSCAIRTSPRR